MAHNTRIRPDLAAWAPNSVVTPEEFNALDQGQFEAINGDDGGLWVPSSPIIIGGAGQRVIGPAEFYGQSTYIAAMQAQGWPERYSVANPTPANTDVPIAYAPPNSGLGNGGGLLVCTSYAGTTSFFSDDGSIWTNGIDSFGGDLTGPAFDLAFGKIAADTPGFLISSPGYGSLAKSTDGANWDPILSATVGAGSVLCFAPSLNRWVAASSSGGAIYSSDDYGATWTARWATAGNARRVVWSGSRFVVLPSTNPYDKFSTSADGLTWTDVTVSSSRWGGLAYSAVGGGWLAVSNSSAKAWRSPDGLAWSDTAFSGPLGQCNDLAVNRQLWVAAGLPNTGAPPIAWSVDHGSTWQRVSVGNHRVASVGYRRVIAADDRFVAVKANGTALEFALSLRSS